MIERSSNKRPELTRGRCKWLVVLHTRFMQPPPGPAEEFTRHRREQRDPLGIFELAWGDAGGGGRRAFSASPKWLAWKAQPSFIKSRRRSIRAARMAPSKHAPHRTKMPAPLLSRALDGVWVQPALGAPPIVRGRYICRDRHTCVSPTLDFLGMRRSLVGGHKGAGCGARWVAPAHFGARPDFTMGARSA